MQTKITLITPEIASRLLANNGNNRSIRKGVMQKYADDMNAGRWQENGESIVISESGELLDGQHRLMAIVASGKSFNFVVVSGVKNGAFSTIDIGAVRKTRDVLSIEKIQNSGDVAAVLNAIKAFEIGTVAAFHCSIHPQEVIEVMNTYGEDEIRHAMSISRGARELKASRALLAGAAFWYLVADREKAENFFSKLISGAGLSIDDPVLHLRNRLIGAVAKNRQSNAELLIRSIDYHHKGRKIMLLRNYQNLDFPKLLSVLGIK